MHCSATVDSSEKDSQAGSSQAGVSALLDLVQILLTGDSLLVCIPYQDLFVKTTYASDCYHPGQGGWCQSVFPLTNIFLKLKYDIGYVLIKLFLLHKLVSRDQVNVTGHLLFYQFNIAFRNRKSNN